ncbi:MAG TPA: hypothetical protein DHW78_00905 [Ruminococcaceae bacterium]|jgi:serine protease Do|nr:trypsin-like peptidase domain-containing protein [Oscillospiraceae bacterium]HCA72140.1 hypothetical protein [Oscillospiraceae bacterium]HCC02225.1 hypothetical protein [Oscillospiraceae bacterium]HCM22874.1 hypothetical protein [Oscillospiraceae bacterium]
MEEKGPQVPEGGRTGPEDHTSRERQENQQHQFRPAVWYPFGNPKGAEHPQPSANQDAGRQPPAIYQNPAGLPKKPKKPLTKQVKILISILLVLFVIFVGMLIGFGVHDARQGRNRIPSESQEPSTSSETTVSRSKHVVPNRGEGTKSLISIQHKSGKPMNPENVFTTVSPSVVGVLASIPTETGQPAESQGTGIVASSDGVILTNSHVIGNSRSATVTVILSNGKQYDARILGYDKTSDLAVLKISASGLTAAKFGSEEDLKVGERVLAIGDPDGMNYSNSLTGGYVSALNRPIAGHSDNGMTYIQTDAAINPGNSGGPLCNLYGQVVGINSCKIITTGYEGMGFSIPVSHAVTIINQLIQNGYVKGRTRLGIVCRVLSPHEAAMLNLKGGLKILSIDSGSSLNSSDVRRGDILYQINGKQIMGLDDVTGVISEFKPGDEVSVKVYSAKQQRTLNIKIKLLEDKGETQKTVSEAP